MLDKIKKAAGMCSALLIMGAAFISVGVSADEYEEVTVGFEEETHLLIPRGETESLTRTDLDAYTGEFSLLTENRSEAWNGPSIRIENKVDLSKEYLFSVWVKFADKGLDDLQLSTQIGEGDNASYQIIDTQSASADEWINLEGTYRYDGNGDGFISVYVESVNNQTVPFYIDDFTMTSSELESDVSIETELQPIKDVYADHFLIGNAVSMAELEGRRLDLLTHHHNLVTAENAMKPEYAYGADRAFDFKDQQRLVDRIQEEGLKLHGHVLVWHQQSPEWLHTQEGELLSRKEALQNMERHIEETILQYGDDVIAWEVVNEAMNDDPRDPEMWRTMLRRSEWYEAIGDDYLELAYMKAREVLDTNGWEDVKLYYNDYNDDNQNKAIAIYTMVKEINDSYAEDNPGELLIDGIGMQGHYNIGTSVDNVRQSIERFRKLGVEIGITELDITAGGTGELSEEQEIDQALIYAGLFKLYKEHSDIISRVTFWGLNDATSWRSERSPLLFDRDLKAKKAYEAVIDPEGFLARYGETGEVDKQTARAGYGTPDLSVTDDAVWTDAAELTVDRYQIAWKGASGIGRVLWDENNLYVRVEVTDDGIDVSGKESWEQDSVEVFVNTSLDDSASYQDGDGQYRVNAQGEESFGEMTDPSGIESRVHETDKGYTVQVAIPWQIIEPEPGQEIGFDLQINDANSGARESIAVWNDLTGQAYQNTSVFGVLELAQNGQSTTSSTNESDSWSPWMIGGTAGSLIVVGIGTLFVIKQKNQ
ncbi:endo-1,4-beta-xylanase [Alkalibacterium putridalgicola]|uniref:endo-1,4-beta-xylanase n=1 Tax=Alkalibacterium putridalgicola TaxID=426703 RepID=UPI0034CE4144